MVKKSKAIAAAERIADKSGAPRGARADDGPPPPQWTRGMVERAIAAFNDIDRVPDYDEDGIRRLVRDFLRFVDRMETGGIAEEALPLARAFAERGYAWLAERPQYAPFATQMWTLEMIETLILWFNDNSGVASAGAVDKKRLFEVAERFHTFERVYKTGAVEPGDAESLAVAFLDYGHRWLERQPDALAHYQSL